MTETPILSCVCVCVSGHGGIEGIANKMQCRRWCWCCCNDDGWRTMCNVAKILNCRTRQATRQGGKNSNYVILLLIYSVCFGVANGSCEFRASFVNIVAKYKWTRLAAMGNMFAAGCSGRWKDIALRLFRRYGVLDKLRDRTGRAHAQGQSNNTT